MLRRAGRGVGRRCGRGRGEGAIRLGGVARSGRVGGRGLRGGSCLLCRLEEKWISSSYRWLDGLERGGWDELQLLAI